MQVDLKQQLDVDAGSQNQATLLSITYLRKIPKWDTRVCLFKSLSIDNK